DKQIKLKFIAASDPEKLTETHQLTLDGELLSSRLVDGVLYLLSRHSTQYYVPFNTEAQHIKPPLDFFLPHYQMGDSDTSKPLVESSQCYIAPQNNTRYNQATLSVITAIPVDNPEALQSRCIAGELDTFYASANALYFSTSRYPYSMKGDQLVYDYEQEQEQVTDIHKFSLQSVNLDYRGSGQVTGHLGWEKDKKSFRFGEYNNTLRVATSIGSSWGVDSRTKVTVLAEDSDSHSLIEVGAVDNLGKPGERLYAARFIGKRGYLVTFRVTDPLIVIDFSQPEKPEVLGELEINGYSDFLQPIGDNFLLGIGKDAIADEAGGGDFRGAWYQGVKLSLFDVSNAENLREVDSIILGKRGTESTVLQDHHGLAILKTAENHYTIALPIELHDAFNKPYLGSLINPLSTYYNWTHTGLYVFDINTANAAALKLNGKLISESSEFVSPDDASRYDFINDRAVIQNDSVHFIHGDQVLSS
ncbi:MAG: beta-propeller domain-containing protein, partial [Methyloprofundus sp.]|nr:beta-propeller domain-containing protein [Methyloprofundus sp.]